MKLRKILLGAGMALCCLLTTGCNKQVGNSAVEIALYEGDKIAEISIEGYGVIKAKLFPDIAPMAVENLEKLSESEYYNGLKIHRVAKDMCIQGGSQYGDGTGGESPLNSDGYFANEINEEARHFYGALCMANQDGRNTTQFYIVTAKTTMDITDFDESKIQAKADEFTAQKEGLEETDPELEHINAQEAYYTNLASMMAKVSSDVAAKYMTAGGYPLWDGGDTVFGQVIEGFDVLDKIAAVEVTTSATGEVSKPVQDIIIESVKVYEYVPPQPESEPEESSSGKKKK